MVKRILATRFHNIGVLVAGFALDFLAAVFEVTELSMKALSDGSIIEFESSFCGAMVGDTIPVMLTGENGDAATTSAVAASVKAHNGATPNQGKKKGGERTANVTPVIGPDGRTVDLTLDAVDEGSRTVHARVELSTGDNARREPPLEAVQRGAGAGAGAQRKMTEKRCSSRAGLHLVRFRVAFSQRGGAPPQILDWTEGAHSPELGGALIAWVEPMPEHVVGCNRL